MRTMIVNAKRQIVYQVPGKSWNVKDFLSHYRPLMADFIIFMSDIQKKSPLRRAVLIAPFRLYLFRNPSPTCNSMRFSA